MANVNLNKVFRREGEKQSSLDSTITLRRDQSDTFTYSDIKFDLDVDEITEFSFNSTENGHDLRRITDLHSVVNSLYNILSTQKGSRLLDPDIDTNITGLLFEPVNEHQGFLIASNLSERIPIYEPRVKIQNIHVTAHYEADLYEIQMDVAVPSLGATFSVGQKLYASLFMD